MTIAAIIYVLAWVGLCVSAALYAASRPPKSNHKG